MFQNMDFQKTKILVVGDVMLDRYWHGGTSRISPEAPVPVVHVQRIDERPGGAANVALGIKALGAKPYLLGICGLDEAGEKLASLLAQKEVEHHFVCVPDQVTITKLRIISQNHQMIRLDRENSFANIPKTQIIESYLKMLKGMDAIILSDYAKGTLSDALSLIRYANEHKIPIVVDPKSKDFSIYRGATVLTPNLKEFEEVAGKCHTIDELVTKAKQIMQQNHFETMVITRSEHGLSVIPRVGDPTHIPALAREVHDVTGAGDTVIAAMSVAFGSGMDIVKASTLANIAAGIVVGKLGAATVSAHEIQVALDQDQTVPTGVMNEEDLLAAIRVSKAKGERIVFTNGCFDILHAGHVMYLEQAQRLGDRVVVAVNTDASVSKLKGPTRPINSVEDRMNVLAGLRSVDWVVPFSEDTPERIIQEISPHVLVKGGDYNDIHAIPGAKHVLNSGGKVQLLGLKEGRSTTKIIESINTKVEDTSLV